jgi:hypothetical protein
MDGAFVSKVLHLRNMYFSPGLWLERSTARPGRRRNCPVERRARLRSRLPSAAKRLVKGDQIVDQL